jgi:hypothetical protein
MSASLNTRRGTAAVTLLMAAVLLVVAGVAPAATTVSPAGDNFTVSLQVGSNATFTIPRIATFGCAEAGTEGTVPALGNENPLPNGIVPVRTNLPTFGTCTAPAGWAFAPGGQPAPGTLLWGMGFQKLVTGKLYGAFGSPPGGIRIVLRRNGEAKNCTIRMPFAASFLTGKWTNGEEAENSRLLLAVETRYVATPEPESTSCTGEAGVRVIEGTYTGAWRIEDTFNPEQNITIN